MKRDLTKAQFEYRAAKLGFTPDAASFLGYWTLSDRRTHVSIYNAGDRRRDQLRYLISEDKKCTRRTSLKGLVASGELQKTLNS